MIKAFSKVESAGFDASSRENHERIFGTITQRMLSDEHGFEELQLR